VKPWVWMNAHSPPLLFSQNQMVLRKEKEVKRQLANTDLFINRMLRSKIKLKESAIPMGSNVSINKDAINM
jgi:hypothetical protein